MSNTGSVIGVKADPPVIFKGSTKKGVGEKGNFPLGGILSEKAGN